jgi:hypothetical protein
MSSISPSDLMAKARGITSSIERTALGTQQSLPSQSFGADYNRLREETQRLFPHLGPILPPPATFGEWSTGDSFTKQSYGELHGYSEQIYQLLGRQD